MFLYMCSVTNILCYIPPVVRLNTYDGFVYNVYFVYSQLCIEIDFFFILESLELLKYLLHMTKNRPKITYECRIF